MMKKYINNKKDEYKVLDCTFKGSNSYLVMLNKTLTFHAKMEDGLVIGLNIVDHLDSKNTRLTKDEIIEAIDEYLSKNFNIY